MASAEGRFDVVTFRAFLPLEPETFGTLRSLRSQDGALAAYKGKRLAIDTELEALEKSAPGILGGERMLIEGLAVPFLAEERNLLILRR